MALATLTSFQGQLSLRKRIHAIKVAYSLCQEDLSAGTLLSLKAVTAEDALHEEQ